MEIASRYLLTIALPEISPPVWREVIVPSDIPLDRLHDVIQIVMGWGDSHLYEFTIGDRCFAEQPGAPEDGEPAGTVRLGEVVGEANGIFAYTYDFGDSWQHLIKVSEPELDAEALVAPVVCVDGKRACPPENVGGPLGYEEFCAAIKNRKHPDHLDLKQWYADLTGSATPFKPEAFSVDEANLELRKYLRWNRPRPLTWSF